LLIRRKGRNMSMNIDPVKYEVFTNRLIEVLNEGKEVIRYLSGSTITREAGEVVQGYYLKNGDAVYISSGILMHIMNVTQAIRYMITERYAEDPGIGIYEGDAFISNDPLIGGMHVPDMALVMPFFCKGKHLGYIAGLSHTTEVGAIEPGGMPPGATEAYHDGIHLPVVKIIERGNWRRDIYNMLIRAVRDARGLELDMKARLAGSLRVEKRLKELIDDFGLEFFEQATQRLVDESEEIARQRFKMFRIGKYRSRVFNDTVSPGRDKLAQVELELEFTKDGELIVRLPIVSPQARGFNNSHKAGLEGFLFLALVVTLFYDTRWNTGLTRAVKLEVQDNTRLTADPTCSVAYSAIGINYAFLNAFLSALSRAFYVIGREDEVTTGAHARNSIAWSGIDQFGRRFANILGHVSWTSGGGARIGRDGIDSSVTYHTPWCYASDQEGEEGLAPLLRLVAKQSPDSGGFGRWRGGVCTEGINIVHKSDQVTAYTMGTGKAIQLTEGLFGGYPPAVTLSDEFKNTNFYEQIEKGGDLGYDILLTPKLLTGEYIERGASTPASHFKSGDMQIWRGGAGAGLGDPLERDPALIVKDIKDGTATLDLSQKVYAVAINPQTLEVDYKETEKRRQERRKQRLRSGTPAMDYIKQLVQKREKKELPKPCQEWLDETAGFCKAFQEQLEFEKSLALNEEGGIKVIKVEEIKGVRFKLTLYVNVVETEQGDMNVCSKCGFVYGPSGENFKYNCLVYERNPEEIHPPERKMAPNRDWCIYREFYCPSCGTQVEVEVCPHGAPIMVNYKW
jgi:N-methylhydantoinase B/oxoprolinase/acetone carboxylase alpha subunit